MTTNLFSPFALPSYLADDVHLWLTTLSSKRRPRTVQAYGDEFSRYARWVGGRGISDDTAIDYIKYLTDKGLRGSSIAVAGYALTSYFAYMGMEIKLDIPPIKIKESKYLNKDEVRRFLSAVRRPWAKCLAHVLYDSGCRISEVLALDMSDLDLDKSIMKVVRKGGRSGFAKLSEDGVHALEEWIEERGSGGGRVFSDFQYQDAWQVFKKAAESAGLEHFTPHILRHSRARHLLYDEGFDPYTVRDLLGHSSIRTTMDIDGRRDVREIKLPTLGE